MLIWNSLSNLAKNGTESPMFGVDNGLCVTPFVTKKQTRNTTYFLIKRHK